MSRKEVETMRKFRFPALLLVLLSVFASAGCHVGMVVRERPRAVIVHRHYRHHHHYYRPCPPPPPHPYPHRHR